ncbi:hypothetical protein PTTG_12089 [Puccinia triticina 1-1 BBBD Race 1]|uniref:Lysophospholipase n=1 Tax=Puccinia triticina (isolate 1-1 / race 1 (BBBD)) TaxID=630390 RepID=A0A180GM47_PUCT1|nr:hypothetical protein PTTG_12089 [Puccinia triticina 1-1 BBBD Race 1]
MGIMPLNSNLKIAVNIPPSAAIARQRACYRMSLALNLIVVITLFITIYASIFLLIILATPDNPRLFARSPALTNSPSGGYAPVWVDCPNDLSVRQPTLAGPLASKEAEYIKKRTLKSVPYWRSYLSRAGLSDFDIESFLKKASTQGAVRGLTLPNVGLALSGGGPRAALIGASMVHALDDRNPDAVRAGTGGIIQLVNYITGLSGGSWFTGSWSTSNFPDVRELVSTWKLQQDNQPLDWETVKKYPPAVKIAREKANAGFPASLVDVWSLMVGKHFLNAPDYGKSVLFNSIRDVPAFQNYDAPFPIIVATSRGEKGRSNINLQTPIYEFTPYEFGAWHPSMNGFIPIDYLGTSMFDGKTIPQSPCVKGFDNAAFIMGSSSNILSEPFAPNEKMTLWNKIVAGLYEYFTRHMYDEALVFNPFNGLGTGSGTKQEFPDGKDTLLYLADGGLGGENMPLWPLMQPARNLDVIIAVDAQTDGVGYVIDARGYSNGTSLYMSYQKTLLPDYKGYKFPKIPDYRSTFSELGLHQRPSVFGCYETDAPLVIYFPNYFMVAATDFTTVQASYTQDEVDAVFDNGFAIATQSIGKIKNNTLLSQGIEENLQRSGEFATPEWSTCVACTLIDRQLQRDGIPRTSQCEACFRQHCYVESSSTST